MDAAELSPDEQARFDYLVEFWSSATDDVRALLGSLSPQEWRCETGLPGWDVHAVAAHLAHLESLSAGLPQPRWNGGFDHDAHMTAPTSYVTEGGVLARREYTPEQLIEEFERAVTTRRAFLAANPPSSLADRADGFAATMGWNWDTLLSNRPVDLWMHEQDIRRAIGRPGNLESVAAQHTRSVFGSALGMIVSKRALAPFGATVAFDFTGPGGFARSYTIRADGRAVPTEPTGPAEPTAPTGSEHQPTVLITMPFAEWMARAGGRTDCGDEVTITGDEALGQRVVAALGLTP